MSLGETPTEDNAWVVITHARRSNLQVWLSGLEQAFLLTGILHASLREEGTESYRAHMVLYSLKKSRGARFPAV